MQSKAVGAACGARTRIGGTCRTPAMPNGRCRMHGGVTPCGPALPQFKHGRYSKLLPARLTARAEEALKDPDLLALRDEVALLDVRVGEVLAGLDGGPAGGGAPWGRLAAAVADMKAARTAKDPARLVEAVGRVEALVEAGRCEGAAWEEVQRLVEQRRRLVEAEARRTLLMRRMVPAEEVAVLVRVLLDSVQRHVTDTQEAAAVTADLRAILSRER